MKSYLFALGLGLTSAMPAAATVYSCQSESICMCPKFEGCNAIDKYVDARPNEVCRQNDQVFEATTHRRKITLVGENWNLGFKEARPYFNEFDWYQAAATNDRGLMNLNFDNESAKPNFILRQMAYNSVNEHVWMLTGTCEVIE